MRSRLLLGATAVIALLIVPVAMGAPSEPGGPEATASASVKKKLKKLTKRVGVLEQKLDDQGGNGGGGGGGGGGAPSGPAAGDLTGNYPAPQIAANAVGGGEVAGDSLTGNDVDESTFSTTPSGPAGGGLTGNYPNPIIGLNAVGDAQVASNSLGGADINEATLGQVPSAGSVADLTITERVGDPVVFGDQDANNGSWLSGTSTANCMPGETVIGGGGNWANGTQQADEALAITDSSMDGTTNVWRATAISDADNDTFRAHVLCFQGG